MQPIVVIAEHQGGQIRSVTHDLVACAVRLQRLHPGDIRIVLLDEDPDEMAEALAQKTGMMVIAVRIPGLMHYHGEIYKHALTDLLSVWQPSHVCTAHTSRGLDFAPGLAIRLGATCITGVEGLTECNGRIGYKRAICGGKIMADVCSGSACTILSVIPGSFIPNWSEVTSTGSVERMSLEIRSVRSHSHGIVRTELSDATIDEAKVIVAAGRGIQNKGNLNLIYRLAGLFSKSAVGGSRIVCDMGWMTHGQQIGVTGRSVAPDVYIACGISGAIQHVAGMKGSGFIIAINSDPGAAIFNVSDVCIVEDITTFIPLLIGAYENSMPK
jgi:electron transfer flavoprotein alpha subunit